MNAVSITPWRDIFSMSHADHQEATDGHEDHKQGEQETEVTVMLIHVFSSLKRSCHRHAHAFAVLLASGEGGDLHGQGTDIRFIPDVEVVP